MNTSLRLAAMAALLLAPRITASEMRDKVHVDVTNLRLLRTRFATYGYQPRQTILLETAGLHFRLPSGGVPQTGLYSYFALAGDCEATLTYELLNVPSPRGGYGSGVGLAFDAGERLGRGVIQRLTRPGERSGCVLQTTPGEFGGEMKKVDRFLPAASTRGRIGLRRVKDTLIFLRADAPTDPLTEFDRLPFTDRPIRAVRVFADPGGSPTALDVRVSQIEIRAEEIGAGNLRSEDRPGVRRWLWLAIPAASGAFGYWFWRTRRRRE